MMKTSMQSLLYTLALCLTAGGGAVLAASQAQAAPADASQVALVSTVEVERPGAVAGGAKIYNNPANEQVVPGDKLRITLAYSNNGGDPVSGFDAVNPMRKEFEFISVEQDWALLSVDGGKNWGKLEALSVPVTAADGSKSVRSAVPGDVTHVRWKMEQPLAAGAKGELRFFALLK